MNFSVTDKLLNGIAIAIIQVISPCSDNRSAQECHDDFGPFFGRMMIVFTAVSMILTVSTHNSFRLFSFSFRCRNLAITKRKLKNPTVVMRADDFLAIDKNIDQSVILI